jgi:hypothetical protein
MPLRPHWTGGTRLDQRTPTRHRVQGRGGHHGQSSVPVKIGRRHDAYMTELVTSARRKGTRELLLTGGLIVVYTGLRGTARALAAIESVMR